MGYKKSADRQNPGHYPDSDQHWITKIKDHLRKQSLWVSDEDISNIWVLYSATSGNLRKWLQNDVLTQKFLKETHGMHIDTESVRQTVRKISEPAIRQAVLSIR